MVYSYAALQIVAILTSITVTIEVLSWVVVYRTDAFKRATEDMERCRRQLAILKKEAPASAGPKREKKEKKLKMMDDNLVELGRALFAVKMKSTIIGAVGMIASFQLVSRNFTGFSVARLPFEAPLLLTRLSKRGLTGNEGDLCECAATLIYVLCTVGLRANLIKLLGLGTSSRAAAKDSSFEGFMSKMGQLSENVAKNN